MLKDAHVANQPNVHGRQKVERYKWTMADKPGTYMEIRPEELQVDSRYQREPSSRNKIIALASDWSWIGCGVIIVGYRGDEFYVIDGQHRVLAAKNRGDVAMLPCLVFDTSGIEQEAQGFLRTNTHRKPLTSYDKFNARLTTRDPVAILAARLIHNANRKPASSSGSSDAYNVTCLSLVLDLAEKKRVILERIWPVVVALCQGHPMHNRILAALAHIEDRMPNGESLADARWFRRIQQVGYVAILDQIQKAAGYYASGGASVWAEGARQAINKGLRNPLEISVPETLISK